MARNLSNAAASLLPYSTIEAAASGNVDAINAVLKHYERYIAALATRTLYDENGVPHLCLDEEKVCRMRTKLIKMPLLEYVKKLSPSHPARALLSISDVAPSRTRGSFYTSALTTLRLFTSKSIYAITHTSDFITMAFLLIGNIPLLYFLNKDWYDVLVNTGFGKGILAVCLLVLLISFAAVIRLTKPVEYKR